MVCIVRLADSAWRIALDHFQNFMFILTTVNQRYGKLISDVKVWSEYFPAFADHLGSMGFPIQNGVMMVDGTLKETSRPGG